MWGPDQLKDQSRQKVLTAAAQVLCEMCPLRASCLADAIASEDQHGVFGGLRVKGRRQIARLAAADGVVPDGSAMARSKFVKWLQAHPEAIDQAKHMQSESRRAERGDRRSRAISHLGDMERRVSFIGSSPGCGKTVSVLSVAWALSRLGEKVRVVDMDPSAKCVEWSRRTLQSGKSVPFEVIGAEPTSEQCPPPSDEYPAWTLIDAPSGNGRMVAEAVDSSNLAVIATRSDEESLKSTWEIAHHLGVACSAVITRVEDVKEGKRAHQWCDDHGVGHAIAVILEESRLRDMLREGGQPHPGTGYATLANELRDVFCQR